MNKKLHMEMIRIIAIILVVYNHSDMYYTYYTHTENMITFSSSLLISSICKVNVPLFMMITGALLIPKAETWREILKKRVSRMLIVLIVFSTLIYGLKCFVWHQDVFSVGKFIEQLLTGEIQESYWYLYEYISILVMLPFLGAIARNIDGDSWKYFMGIGIACKVGVAVITFFTGYSSPFNFFILQNNVLYVLLGYYSEKVITDERCKQESYGKIVMGFMISILFTAGMVLADKRMSGEYHEYVLSILTPVMALFIYIGLRKFFIEHACDKTAGIIRSLGGCAFGIYLLEHIGQKTFLWMYLWLADRTFGILACSIYVLCILMFGFIGTVILKKTKIMKLFL